MNTADLQKLIWLSAYATVEKRTPPGTYEKMVTSTLQNLCADAVLALQEHELTANVLKLSPEHMHVWASSFADAYLEALAPGDASRRTFALAMAQASVDTFSEDLMNRSLNLAGGYGLRLVRIAPGAMRVKIVKCLRDLAPTLELKGAVALLNSADRYCALLLSNCVASKALHWQEQLGEVGAICEVIDAGTRESD